MGTQAQVQADQQPVVHVPQKQPLARELLVALQCASALVAAVSPEALSAFGQHQLRGPRILSGVPGWAVWRSCGPRPWRVMLWQAQGFAGRGQLLLPLQLRVPALLVGEVPEHEQVCSTWTETRKDRVDMQPTQE
jgi:hypothetical protein